MNPESYAKGILRNVWGYLNNLQSSQYNRIVILSGLEFELDENRPSALEMTLKLANLWEDWNADGRPTNTSWFLFKTN
jgi:hypothetical protein